MILGVGVDLVEVARIERALARFGDRFAHKILWGDEITAFSEKSRSANWLAKRFAAKEAVAKALGTGMGGGVHFHHIVISSKRSGAPLVTLLAAAEARSLKLGVVNIHLSIADEKNFAVGFVVLES